jgi:hypothetical protein
MDTRDGGRGARQDHHAGQCEPSPPGARAPPPAGFLGPFQGECQRLAPAILCTDFPRQPLDVLGQRLR